MKKLRGKSAKIIGGLTRIDLLFIPISIVIIGLVNGLETLYFLVPIAIIIHGIQYPFQRVAEISSECLTIRRNYRKFGKVRTFKIDEIRSAATESFFGRPPDCWLVLHHKNDTVERVYLGKGFNRAALENELGKYVEIFTPNFKDL